MVLVEEYELLDCWPSARDYFEELSEAGLGYTWFPIPDYEAPDPDEALNLFRELSRIERLGGILFHCYGGRGRTPTMIAAYLVTVHGLSLEEALSLIGRAVAPDLSDEQLLFLEMMERFYRGKLRGDKY